MRQCKSITVVLYSDAREHVGHTTVATSYPASPSWQAILIRVYSVVRSSVCRGLRQSGCGNQFLSSANQMLSSFHFV